jgi:predicted ABC-type transport system involved in lysophospholipase L1 biosynthesis ATPase subunit
VIALQKHDRRILERAERSLTLEDGRIAADAALGL